MPSDEVQTLLRRARGCRFCRGDLADLASQLPGDEEALDALINESVSARDELAFRSLVFASLQAGRSIDARHLVRGGALFDKPDQLSAAAMRMSGDVCGALVKAVKAGNMGFERSAVALFVGAGWWRKKEQREEPVPAELIAEARVLARQTRGILMAQLLLGILAHFVDDEGLESIIKGNGYPGAKHEYALLLEKMVTSQLSGPPDIIPDRPPPVEISGYTVRRAVKRVGRNEPCPCGSGRKYKKCCWEKDQERLQHPSGVEGVTREEVVQRPEEHLTFKQLSEMRSYELARIDPVRMDPRFRPRYVEQLVAFRLYDLIVRYFETIKDDAESHEGGWVDAMDEMAKDGERALMERMLRALPEARKELGIGARLFLAEDVENRSLELIESEIRKALKEKGHESPVSLAYSLLESRWPGLGLIVARGVVPVCDSFEGLTVLEVLLETRDRMGLSATDPIEPIVDQLLSSDSNDSASESESLNQVRDRLDQKTAEVKQLNSKLRALETQLERREKLAARRSPKEDEAGRVQPAPASSELDAMRRQLKGLKNELKERHNERNELRRDLRTTLREVEALRERPPANAEESDATGRENEEEDALLAEGEPGDRAVRVPVFPEKFAHRLGSVPKPVARSAMALIGRLASGEAAAFAGARKLKSTRGVIRQRVGLGHRLLFRMSAERLEVIDLIPRRDLEQRIRGL